MLTSLIDNESQAICHDSSKRPISIKLIPFFFEASVSKNNVQTGTENRVSNKSSNKDLPTSHCHENGLSTLHFLQSPELSRVNGFLQIHVFDSSTSTHSTFSPAHGVIKFSHFSHIGRGQTCISIDFARSHFSS